MDPLKDPVYTSMRLFGGLVGQPAIPIEVASKSFSSPYKERPVEFKPLGRKDDHMVVYSKKTKQPAILSIVGPYLWGSPCDTGNFVPPDATIPPSVLETNRKDVANYDVQYSFALSTIDPRLQRSLERMEKALTRQTKFNSISQRPRKGYQDPSLPLDYIVFSAPVFKRVWGGEPVVPSYKPHPWIREAQTEMWSLSPTRPDFFVLGPNNVITPLEMTGSTTLKKGDVVFVTFTIAYKAFENGWKADLVPVEIVKIGELGDGYHLGGRGSDGMEFLLDRPRMRDVTTVDIAPQRQVTDSGSSGFESPEQDELSWPSSPPLETPPGRNLQDTIGSPVPHDHLRARNKADVIKVNALKTSANSVPTGPSSTIHISRGVVQPTPSKDKETSVVDDHETQTLSPSPAPQPTSYRKRLRAPTPEGRDPVDTLPVPHQRATRSKAAIPETDETPTETTPNLASPRRLRDPRQPVKDEDGSTPLAPASRKRARQSVILKQAAK